MALGKTIAEIEDEMTYAEYQSWQRFYEVEPFGDVRADLRSGIVSALIARTMGGSKTATPMDYMPIVNRRYEEGPAKTMTQAEKNKSMRQVFEGNLGPMRVRNVKLKRR